MTDDIVARLRHWANGAAEQGVQDVVDGLNCAADEIELLRARIAELERFAGELDASGRKNTEPAALRSNPSDAEASASEGYLNTGESVQTEKAD
jgi:hypothetical protein